MSFIMSIDIQEKGQNFNQKLLKAIKPMIPYLGKFQKKEVTVDFINQNASKMAKVSEDFYKFIKKEAKAAGAPDLSVHRRNGKTVICGCFPQIRACPCNGFDPNGVLSMINRN